MKRPDVQKITLPGYDMVTENRMVGIGDKVVPVSVVTFAELREGEELKEGESLTRITPVVIKDGDECYWI